MALTLHEPFVAGGDDAVARSEQAFQAVQFAALGRGRGPWRTDGGCCLAGCPRRTPGHTWADWRAGLHVLYDGRRGEIIVEALAAECHGVWDPWSFDARLTRSVQELQHRRERRVCDPFTTQWFSERAAPAGTGGAVGQSLAPRTLTRTHTHTHGGEGGE